MGSERSEQPGASGLRYELLIAEISGVRAEPLPESGELVVGRSRSADIRITDPSISRRHARVAVSGGVVTVEDLGSDNGTLIHARVAGDGDGPTADLAALRLEANTPSLVEPDAVIQLGAISIGLRAISRDDDVAAALDLGEGGPMITSAEMRRLYSLAIRVAGSRLPVVILGETGVGKESLARTIHAHSPRAGAAFVAINGAGVVESLFESELFGHVRGAFTGAHADKRGLFEVADGGTLFLDEIGELPPTQQAKLLRVIEDGVITRVGGLEPIEVDVRFVTATNRDLEAEIEAGNFRQDLFFRLSGLVLRVPPLRERADEIAPLAAHFAVATGASIGDAAMRQLEAHSWPGNVRELKQAIERAVVLADGAAIAPEHLLLGRGPGNAGGPGAAPVSDARERAQRLIDEAERAELISALAECGGNQTRAAELLGISRRTLVRRIARHQLPRPRKS
jgi:DNA-binding NtrC family response regulator